MKKYLLLLFLPLLLLAGVKQEALVVGTTTEYAPFVSLDKNGNYEGFDIDFAKELAQKLGRELVIRDCGSMASLLVALEKKKIDVIIWGMSMTPERMKKIEMIYYQGEKTAKMPFLFWENVPDEIKSIEDLGKDPSCIVSVEAGSYQEAVLQKYPSVRLKQVEKITDGIMEIRFGKSSAAMIDPALVSELTAQYSKLRTLYFDLRPEECALGNGVCVNKKNQKLIAEVQKATDQLIQEGAIISLEKKWNMVQR